MADQIIGSVGIQIEADASDLQGQYDAAVAQSQEAAGKISAAFESLVGIGTALAITEGIKEFGEEALTAFGDIEKTTISIEHMTGSMADTMNILEQVKAVGLASPFSFPELQDTTQKMIAMGVPVEKIGDSLRGIADAAAATGKSLLVAGGAFDRITETGSAAARQLAQLGVTTERLADAMGVTRDRVLQAFKDLPDQAARIDVLNKAMERFAGSAEAQADGIRGAWQILENRFELIMQGIGSAMEPTIKQIIDFGTTASKYAQEAIDVFNQLPGPVKEIAVAIGLTVTAIAPLAAGAGTLGIALIGIKAVVGDVTTLLRTFGIISTEAAVSQAALGTSALVAAPEVKVLGIAEASAGEAASISAIQLGLFGEEIDATVIHTSAAITQLGLFNDETKAITISSVESTAAVNSATFGFKGLDTAVGAASIAMAGLVGYKVGQWAYDNVPGVKAFGDSLADLASKDPLVRAALLVLTGDLKTFKTAMDDQSEGASLLSQKLGALGIVIHQGSMTTDEWIAAMMKAVVAHTSVQDKVSATQLTIDALTKTVEGNSSEVNKWKDAVALAASQLDGSAEKAEVYQAALQKLDAAQKKLAAGSKDYQDTLSGLTETYNKQQSTINTLENTIGQLLAVQDRTAAQDTLLAEATTKLTGLLKQQADAHGLVAAAAQGQGKAYDSLVKSADELITKEIASGLAVVQAKAVLDQLTESTDKSAEHQRAVNDAIQQYATALKQSGGALTDQIAIEVNGVAVLTTVGDALNKAKEAQGGFTTSIVNGVEVTKSLPDAMSKVNDAYQHVGTGAATAAAQIDHFTASVQMSTDTSKPINYYSSLAASISHVGEATSTATAVNDAWNGSIVTSVDNASKFANSINGITAALHNMATAEDAAGTAAFDADKSFKATTSSVNALSVGVAFLAMQLSGLTAFAGSGINYAAGGSDLQHQLYLAQQAAGNPIYQPTSFTVSTGGSTKGDIFGSQADLNTALQNASKGVTALTTATTALGNATQNTTDSLTQYVDGVGNVYDSYQKMIDAINANPDLGGLTSTITKSTTALQNLSNAVGQSGSGTTGAVTGLTSNVTDLAGAALSTAQAVSLAAATMQVATADLNNSSAAGSGQVRGPDGKMYSTAQDLYNAIQANPNLLPHTGEGPTSSLQFGTGGAGGGGGQFTFNGQSVTEAMYNALMQGMKGGSTAMSADILPAMQNNGTPSGFTGTSGTVYKNDGSMQPITVNMSYPQFNNQQQADQIMKQIVTQLRTVAGQKL